MAEAADAASQAKEHAQIVFRSDSENDRNKLAAALNNFAVHHSVVGRFEEALEFAAKAEEISRGLAESSPTPIPQTGRGRSGISAAFAVKPADSRTGSRRRRRPRRSGAGWRKQPDAYTPDWATSLGISASVSVTSAASRRHSRSQRRPKRFRGGWRKSSRREHQTLGDMARQSRRPSRDVGRFEEALQKSEKAEEISRGLAESSPTNIRQTGRNRLPISAAIEATSAASRRHSRSQRRPKRSGAGWRNRSPTPIRQTGQHRSAISASVSVLSAASRRHSRRQRRPRSIPARAGGKAARRLFRRLGEIARQSS